MSSKTDPKYWI